jgi:hypothetical protein
MASKDVSINLTKKDADAMRESALFFSRLKAFEAICEKIGSRHLAQLLILTGGFPIKLQSTSFNMNCDGSIQEGISLNPEGEDTRWKTEFTDNYGRGWKLETTWGRRQLTASRDSKGKIDVKAFLPVDDIVSIMEEKAQKLGGRTRNEGKLYMFLNDLKIAGNTDKYYPFTLSSVSEKSSIIL